MRKACYTLCLLLFCKLMLFSQAQPLTSDAGPDRAMCDTGYATLGGSPAAKGGNPPYKYSWTPKAPLNYDTVPNPIAYVTSTTNFTLVVRDNAGAISTDQVLITVYNYTVDAGKDTTIKQGQTITLHGAATNATQVHWMPDSYEIFNPYSWNPDVFPSVTTTYTLYVSYTPGGCPMQDYITVMVEASDELVFYNTFTPNGDGVNDYFLIGNISKYPENVLEIYNRYGQKVFSETGYHNDWSGKYLNQELPSGTYFYFLDTKSDKGGKHHGQVNIIR